MPEQQGVVFEQFGGLRLDQGLNEVGPESAVYLRDVDWDGSLSKIRSRDGFEKLKASEATGPYKGLYPHSSLRLLAIKRIKAEEVKIVAIDREGEEKTNAAWTSTEAKSCFASIGTPSASYTYARAATSSHKVVRFDGTSFTEPTATVDGAGSKEMPRGNLMAAWPDAGNRLVVANTGSEGGPNKATSSASYVWFSEPGNAESYESTAYVQLAPGDGEEITALAVSGGRLFVFKETKFFVFYEPSTSSTGKPVFNFYEVTLGQGARVKRATSSLLAETSDQVAVSDQDGVYFCTSNGVYWTTGNAPAKISDALKPLEETTPFDGPMADLLDGASETFRWPATGIASLGDRLVVRRYEFMFIYDKPNDAWTCWRMPAVSMAVWHGLSGGGSEAVTKAPGTASGGESELLTHWTNPNNAKAEDGSCATVKLDPASADTLTLTNFGFDLPSEAVIEGIQVSIRRKGSSANCLDESVRILKAGSPAGEDKASASLWPTSLTTTTYGGSTSLWGTTWSVANIEAEGFGVSLAVQSEGLPVKGSVTAEVDYVSIAVFSSLPTASSGVRPRLLCTQEKHVYWTGPAATDDAGTSQPAWESGLYDFQTPNEKSLTLAELWGSGEVDLAVSKDFGEIGAGTTFELGEAPAVAMRQKNKSQTGRLFSHRLSGDAPWSVQRLVRYVEVEGVSGNDRP